MASNYPAALDSLSNPASGDALSTGHAAQHGNVNDAVEAIEGELGTDPAGASATVKARFEAIEANSWVTSARIADGTVTGTDIASGTVTSANLVDGTIVNADVSGTAAIDKTKISGTAVTVADTGTVTSAMIADGTIVNGDVNASAAIAATKISGTAVTQADSGTVTSTMIANGTITGTDIASGTVTSTNIADGTIVNADVATGAAIDVAKLTGVVTSAGVGNLLTSAQATGSEAPTNGVNTNCTLSVDNSQYYQGTDSLLMTSSASGIMASKYFTVSLPAAGTYTVFCRVRTDQTVMGLIMSSTGTGITSDSAKVAANSTGWTNYVSVITTTQATTLSLYAATTGTYGHPTGAGQKLWLDTLGVWQGAGGLWALPGTPIANLGTYTDESVGRRIFTWDTVNARWQMSWSDSGWRTVTAGLDATYLTNNPNATLTLRRMGNQCHAYFDRGASPTTTTGLALLYAIPAGFRIQTSTGAFTAMASVDGNYVSTTASMLVNVSDTNIYTSGTGATTRYRASLSWTTADAWPTALPGAALGSIPQ